MATEKQKKAVEKYVEKRGAIGMSKAMREAGYSEKTAKNPKNLTESRGYQELIKEYADEIGATPEFVLKALKDDIERFEGERRSNELNLLSKVLGMQTDKVEVQNKVVQQLASLSYDDFSESYLVEVEKTEISPPEND